MPEPEQSDLQQQLAAVTARLADVGERLVDANRELAESADLVRAIRSGEVDALVVIEGAAGEKVFTLASADRPYRTFVENMHDGAVTLSATGVILYANERVAELLSLSLGEIIGASITRFVAPDEQPRLAALTGSDGAGSAAELTLIGPGGAAVPVLVGSAHSYVDDSVVCLTFTDLTARRDADEANAQLAAIVDSSDDAIFGATLDGRITSWNAAAERMLGYSAENMIGQSPSILAPAELAGEFPAILSRIANGGRVARAETVQVDAGGRRLDVSMTVSPTRSSAGVTVGVSIIARDVTERRRNEAELRESRDQTRSIIETASDPFLSMDAAGVVTDWNQRAEAVFGWARTEAVGRPMADLLIPERLRDAHGVGLRRYLAGGEPHVLGQRLELPALHRSGAELEVELSVWQVESRDGPHFNAFLHDISERKQTATALGDARDQALEASRLKSQFLAAMSHEIRTPMNGVIGLTELLLDSPLDEAQRRNTEGIRTAGDALLSVLNDILDFSKIEAGKVVLDDVNFSVDGVVSDVLDLLTETARAKGLTLSGFCDPALILARRGDPGRLRQVLLNLAANAVKFTESGSVAIRALSEAGGGPFQEGAGTGSLGTGPDAVEPSRSDVIRFEVIDTGIGLSVDEQLAVFEPFAQADASTTRRYGGTGLGLAISRQLVEAMGGALGVVSVSGEGSTFWARIPLLPQDVTTESVAISAIPSGRRSSEASGHLLLVEDNAINQLVAVGMLTKLGYTMDVARNGIEALEMAARQMYAAILMDCQMPLMDGYAATAELRHREAGGPRLPIIAMTASALRADEDRCLAAGMDDYVSKPVRLDALAEVLSRWLTRSDPSVAAVTRGPSAR